MNYDFDKIIDRSGSGDLKHEVLKERYGRDDILPLWVADMDFETPDFILDAMRKRMEHPIFGYTVQPEEYWPTVKKWIADHHQWDVKEEWMTYIPGVVRGLGFAINALTEPGDKIIIQTPVYHPFRTTIEGNGRCTVKNQLIETDGDNFYEMDFDNLLSIIDGAKMLVLCNPHNPAGITWSKETLQRLADICYEHNVIVISDEIHADLALFGHKHIPFASVSEEAAMNSITFMAPTKTFNMAGIISAYSVIPNPSIRERYYQWLDTNELSEPNIFAPIATIAAYRKGEAWRQQLIQYIEQNILFAEQYVAQHLPQVKVVRPEASFLVWLDCRALGLSHEALIDLFVNRARLALNDGEMFGHGGEGFMRMNVGCPRTVLQQALERLTNCKL